MKQFPNGNATIISSMAKVSNNTVAPILYTYIVNCAEELIATKRVRTPFGMLTLDDNDMIHLNEPLQYLADQIDIPVYHNILYGIDGGNDLDFLRNKWRKNNG